MGRVEEIEGRLSKATPGPWQWIDNDLVTTSPIALAEEYELHQVEIIITDSGFYPPRARDQPFIAHAPEDVAYLLARVRELEAALGWYADGKSYEYPGGSGNKASPVQRDAGERARAALAGGDNPAG